MSLPQEVVEIREVLNSMPSKAEKRRYLLTRRRSGYDFTDAINYLLFGPHEIRDTTLGFYILKAIAFSNLLKFELAWCYINGYGCEKTAKNQLAGKNLLIKLGDEAFMNHPETLFKSDFSGISWSESALEEERDQEINRRERERLEDERIREEFRLKREAKKKHLIKTRQWRNKHRILCFLIEVFIPVVYYVIITSLLDFLSISLYERSTYFKIDALIFQILLITGVMFGSRPAYKTEKLRFPLTVLYLPVINCIYLFWGNSFADSIWVNIILIIIGFIIFKIGIRKQRKRKFLRDFKFFKRIIYPKIPPCEKWKDVRYLRFYYGDLTIEYPHLPKRFSKYQLIEDHEDGLFSFPGKCFGRKGMWENL